MNVSTQRRPRSARVAEWEPEWREAAAADRLDALSAQRRSVRRRLLVLLPAALAAATAPLALWWTPGFSRADTTAAIVASTVAAFVAVAIVPLADRLGRPLAGAGADDRVLFTAAVASAGTAAIHFSAVTMHLDEYALYGVFFVACGIAQLVWPIWLLFRRWTPLLVLGAVGNAGIAALWIVDRVGWVPFGPDASKPPPFGLGDSVASGLEVLIVVACVVALARGRGRPVRWTANLALTLGTAVLTTLALLSVLGVGSSVLPPAM